MRVIEGRLDYTKKWQAPDICLFTGNPITRRDGGLVMGAGAAKQIRDNYPGIDKQFGKLAHTQGIHKRLHFLEMAPYQFLGWFQVKDHWAEPAQPHIILEATNALKALAEKVKDQVFHMNYPGIGHGQLPINQVHGIVSMLPDNVLLYR